VGSTVNGHIGTACSISRTGPANQDLNALAYWPLDTVLPNDQPAIPNPFAMGVSSPNSQFLKNGITVNLPP
jgi:hypothetical protein